jgi:hypothetical protein
LSLPLLPVAAHLNELAQRATKENSAPPVQMCFR